MSKKVTKAVLAERVEKVAELLVLGLRTSEIVRYSTEKTDWDVKRRQVEKYIQMATVEITTSAAFDRDHEIAKAVRRYENLYKANMTIQDYKAAASVVKSKAELLGLNAPTRTQVAGTITAMSWREFIESGAAEPGEDADAETEGADETQPGGE